MTRRGQATLALTLWLALAFVVWNVVFDRVVVLAGRRYVADAERARQAGRPYLLIDDEMRPAIRRGVRLASAAALPIVVVGLVGVTVANRRDQRSTLSKNDTALGSSV